VSVLGDVTWAINGSSIVSTGFVLVDVTESSFEVSGGSVVKRFFGGMFIPISIREDSVCTVTLSTTIRTLKR
jgi:hypothetical protein